MKSQEVHEIYTNKIEYKKGNTLKLLVCVEGNLHDFAANGFGVEVILHNWAYMDKGKTIKPFKLLNYVLIDTDKFEAHLDVIKKSTTMDEVMLLCNDVMDILNTYDLSITKWEVHL
ncbi:hypothetical protein [Paenibacillus montanisoli]|uniref:Uncharacterized protein n=1 Tax=Paenibacillus montanisoli TaxID=2081970 RepID=A0A328U7V0_9BACL|nr:hypothetical protein [Paenibacillus montanisoli]RAP78550.1 hypothetical protein DL346_09060 [Paenibacillus montanisoli]